MTDEFRDERGRLKPGAPPLYKGKGKQDQPDTQDQSPDQPDPNTSFDDDIIAAANSYGRPSSKVGRRAFCEDLRDSKPTEFAALLRPALDRKQKETAASLPGIGAVNILSCPADHYLPGDQMRAMWSKLHGTPPDPPVLVVNNPPDIEDEPQAGSPTSADNEFAFGGSEDDATESPPRRSDKGVDMNSLLRAIPRPRFTKPRDDEPW